MPAISMCADKACPSREICYRNPESGTKPDIAYYPFGDEDEKPSIPAQAWGCFQRSSNVSQCGMYWPVKHGNIITEYLEKNITFSKR